ncbi:MAG: PilN domain-containing protein [Lysobacterales bacterium]
MQRRWQTARRRYAASGVRRFVDWWWGELRPLVPASWLRTFADHRKTVLLSPTASGLRAEALGPGAPEPIEIPLDESGDSRWSAIDQLLSRYEERPQVVLTLPLRGALRRSLTLPAAAADNLTQILGFEMDRQTPFRAEQVYYDARVTRVDPLTRALGVDLLLMPRPSLDLELARFGDRLPALDAIDVEGESGLGTRAGFNLLPEERRAARDRRMFWASAALASLVLLLLVAVMAQSVTGREKALADLQKVTARSRSEALSVAQLRRSLTDAIAAARFIDEARAERPVIIDVLKDVTQRLPDEASLQRFGFSNGEYTFNGLSSKASGLIGALKPSPELVSPQVQGSITPDVRTGKEMFTIVAKSPARAAEDKIKEAEEEAERAGRNGRGSRAGQG